MSWQGLLRTNRVRAHATSKNELQGLRELIARDLTDAALSALSADRRFATAYNAVLQLTKMTISCAGYRVVGAGHHQTTFEALEIALGASIAPDANYFDACRRNAISSITTWPTSPPIPRRKSYCVRPSSFGRPSKLGSRSIIRI